MNSEKMSEVTELASQDLADKLSIFREHAEHFVSQRQEELIEKGEAFELTEDEIRLLKGYRSFVSRNKPGKVFAWKTPEKVNFIIPEEPSLIVDPREVCLIGEE